MSAFEHNLTVVIGHTHKPIKKTSIDEGPRIGTRICKEPTFKKIKQIMWLLWGRTEKENQVVLEGQWCYSV